MLNTLLESKSRRFGSRGGTIASAALHGILIAGAAYATASGATMATTPEPIDKIHWVPTTPAPSTSQAQTRSVNRTRGARSIVPPRVLLDLSVPSVSVDVPLAVDEPVSFGRGGGDPVSLGTPGNPGNSAGGTTAYSAAEVERQVSVIPGSARPEYPRALRTSGTEGEVIAQFVVDERGRVSESSLKILSATNELFATSVRVAIARMKFHPAQMGGKPVPQMVQQLFAFRLDR